MEFRRVLFRSFALDPKMSIDVIVYEDRRRVGFLLTALTYAPGP